MKQLLEEVLSELPHMAWSRMDGMDGLHDHNDARFLRGEGKTWTALVADFDISDQGFPPGTRGYDGTATKKSMPVVVHLPRDVAQSTFEKALRENEELGQLLLKRYRELEKEEEDEGTN